MYKRLLFFSWKQRAFSVLSKLGRAQLGGLDSLPSAASSFKKRDLDLLKVQLQPFNNVIPHVEAKDFPGAYVIPSLQQKELGSHTFDIERLSKQLNITDNDLITFILKLHRVVKNAAAERGTADLLTDSLVMNLLVHVLKMDRYPLVTDVHPEFRLFIEGECRVTAIPEYVVRKKDCVMVVIEDKHIKNAHKVTSYGEAQLAAEMLCCASENVRFKENTSQLIFGVRIVSSFVTFYKATISAEYLRELDEGLPHKQSVIVKRWPGEVMGGLDLGDVAARRTVLESLTKIRQFLLSYDRGS